MNRTITRGALFAAPLIIAGSLAAGAMADQSQTIALQQDAGCVVSSTSTAYVGLQNKNAYEVDVTYSNSANGATGTLQVAANSDYLYAIPYDTSNLNNTITYTADGWTSPVSSNANVSNECSATDMAQFAPVASAPTAPTTGSTSTATGTTSTTGNNGNGGLGGDTPVATTTTVASTTPATTNTAATLADTGASQIMPYSAAALIAVATLGMTVAVRKNLI